MPPGPVRAAVPVRAPLTAAATVAAATAGVLLLDPAHRHVPLCPFHAVTGLQCPLCGGLRAVQALTHGDVVTALHANALFVLSLPLVAVLWLQWLRRDAEGRPPRAWPAGVRVGVVVLAVAFAVVRNLPGAEALRPA